MWKINFQKRPLRWASLQLHDYFSDGLKLRSPYYTATMFDVWYFACIPSAENDFLHETKFLCLDNRVAWDGPRGPS